MIAKFPEPSTPFNAYFIPFKPPSPSPLFSRCTFSIINKRYRQTHCTHKNPMNEKFSEAFTLFKDHLPIFVTVVLTIWIPGNLISEFLTYHVFDPDDFYRMFRMEMQLEALLGPIVSGAVIYALYHIKMGKPITYSEVIGKGVSFWWRLFKVRFVSGFLIILGLLLLVVPGFIIAIRLAFVECITALEGDKVGEALKRSNTMTKGIQWELFAAIALATVGASLIGGVGGFFMGFILELVPMLDNFVVSALLYSSLDVLFVIVPIIVFLYYWDVRKLEGTALMWQDMN